jgi:hypothetical protein
MAELFEKVFGKKASPQELTTLRRLLKLYPKELVEEAIRLSVAITEGSPIKYIVSVANNLYKNPESEYNSLVDSTNKKLEELRKYGSNTG